MPREVAQMYMVWLREPRMGDFDAPQHSAQIGKVALPRQIPVR